jgi:hypothetical protein
MTKRLKPHDGGALGRGRVLRHLLSMVRASLGTGRATSVLLTGAPGVGKSVVSKALVEGLVDQLGDVTVLSLTGDPLAQHVSWNGFRTIRYHGDLPSIGNIVERLQAEEWGASSHEPSGPLLAEECRLAHETIMRPLTAAFEQLTRQRVVVVSVEDAHYMDVASLDALSGLMQRFVDRPFIVLLVGWDHVVETTSHLFSNPQMIFEELSSLDPISIRHLVGTWLGPLETLLDDDTKELLASHARGNALFARVLVTDLVQKYDQFGVDGFDPGAFTLPLTIDDLYRMRIERLDSQARDLLNRCALGGFAFGRATACVGNPNSINEAWQVLLAEGIVAVDDCAVSEGLPAARFVSGGFYEVAQSMCSSFRETSLHSDVSRWLSGCDSYKPRDVAYHLVHGGRAAESRSHWMNAAFAAIACGDFRMAISMLDTAAALTLDPSKKSHLLMNQLNLSAALGEWDDVVRLLGSIPSRVVDEENTLAADHAYWRAEAYLAGYGATQGGDLAVDLLQQSRDRAVSAADPVRQVRALTALAIALAKDDAARAQTTWSQALSLAKTHAVDLSIFPFADLCVRQATEDQQGVRVAAQALLSPQDSGVSGAVAIRVAQLLTDMEIAEGQWDAAAFLLEDLVDRTRMMGDRVHEVEALLQWAWVSDQMAAPDTVSSLLERALALALQMGRSDLIERCRRRRSEREQREENGGPMSA